MILWASLDPVRRCVDIFPLAIAQRIERALVDQQDKCVLGAGALAAARWPCARTASGQASGAARAAAWARPASWAEGLWAPTLPTAALSGAIRHVAARRLFQRHCQLPARRGALPDYAGPAHGPVGLQGARLPLRLPHRPACRSADVHRLRPARSRCAGGPELRALTVHTQSTPRFTPLTTNLSTHMPTPRRQDAGSSIVCERPIPQIIPSRWLLRRMAAG